ncbi:MAG: addiction module protein [Candidatus Competibacteraceae bacterium]|nr:addiction module protein [Candidatus Competibacteraceae bacterium]
MTVQEQISQLPRDEKLRLLESLWCDLRHPDSDFESPSWHERALQETEKRLADGNEEIMDWEIAKKRLRNE